MARVWDELNTERSRSGESGITVRSEIAAQRFLPQKMVLLEQKNAIFSG